MGFIQGVIEGFFLSALRWYRGRLEAKIGPKFDPRLSLKLDALAVLLDK